MSSKKRKDRKHSSDGQTAPGKRIEISDPEPTRKLSVVDNGWLEIVIQDHAGNDHSEILDLVTLYREMVLEPLQPGDVATTAYARVLCRFFEMNVSQRVAGEVFYRVAEMVSEIQKKDPFYRQSEIPPNSDSEPSTNQTTRPGSSKSLTPTAQAFCEPNESLTA
jgi:hypothetical protein